MIQTKINEKLANKYGACSKQFVISAKKSLEKPLKFDEKFTKTYPNIVMFDVQGIPIEFDQPEKFFTRLKKISIIRLAKNGLEKIPKSIFDCKDLNVLEVTTNPIKTLDGCKFNELTSLKSLHLSNLDSELKISSKIQLPASLQEFAVRDLKMNDLPFEINGESMNFLNLSGVYWLNPDSYGGNEALISQDKVISSMEDVLHVDTIKKLFQRFDNNNNGFFDKVHTTNSFLGFFYLLINHIILRSRLFISTLIFIVDFRVWSLFRCRYSR